MKNEVVAFLLDESVPAERLGEVLRAARKRRGWKRRQAAKHTGISAGKLRDYERGVRAVPADVCLRLAECYGDDLTAHVPLRVPPRVTASTVVVDGQTRILSNGDAEEVLTSYVEIVARLRRARPGEPVALRASDVAALGAVLGCDPARIEQRIVELLECTREEARALHQELLRRKVILPVAGLAAGIVAMAGFTTANAETSPPTTPTSVFAGFVPAAETEPVAVAPSPTVAPASTPTTALLAPPTEPSPATNAPPPVVEPPVVDAPATDATVPVDQLAREMKPPLDPPEVDPNDTTPMSIPPGENVVIIGTPSSASDSSLPSNPDDAGA
jgi:transcriptional regulator with XRE-family HTH domain